MEKPLSYLYSRLFFVLIFLIAIPGITLAQSNNIDSLFNTQEKQWIKDHPLISIGIDAKWPPIDFIDQSGQHQGITHDYIELLSSQTGIQFTQNAADGWNDMLDKARNRKIDIVATFAKRPEREKNWRYTNSYFQAPYVITTRKEQNSIINLQSLYGKTVAIEKGYNFYTELRKNHAAINLMVVNDTEAALQAVSRNRADAYIGNQAVIFYLAEKLRLTNLKVTADSGYPANKLYFGIRPDWPELVSIIDKILALDSTSTQAKKIEHKWLGLVPQNQSTIHQQNLTTEELDWLEKQPQITVAVMNAWPPFNFLDNKGQPSGIGADIISLLNQQLNNKLTIVPGEWRSIYDSVKRQQLDAILDITPKKGREPFFNFTNPYLDIPHIFIAQKSAPFIKTESNLEAKTLALEQDFVNVEYFETEYPGINLKLYKDTTEALEAVSRGEADAYAGNRVAALYLIEKLALSNLKVHGRLSKRGASLAIGTRKNAPLLRNILQKSLHKIGTEGLRDLTNKWIHTTTFSHDQNIVFSEKEKNWISQHKEVAIGIEGNWPPIDFIDENNQFQGLTAEYMALISKKTNIIFKPEKSSSFKFMLQKLTDGDLKVAVSTSINKNRTDKLLFTQPLFNINNVIITQQSVKDIENIKDLYGKKVTIEDGSSTMQQLQQKHPQIQLIPVNFSLQALQKVSTGDADAYIGNPTLSNWLQQQHQITNLVMSGNSWLGSSTQNFAISKNAPNGETLVGILDKALSSITTEEKQLIENHWLSQATVKSKSIPKLKLNNKQKAWLKAHPEITLGVDNAWKPLEFIDDDDKYQGLSSDFMKYFSQQIGITFKQPENIPWIMVIQGLRDKTIDIAPLVVKTSKRSNFLDFTDHYLNFPMVVFNRRGETLLGGITDLRDKKVGLVRGYAIAEIISKDYPDLGLHYFSNTQQGLEALSVGEVDAFIDVLAVGGYLIATGGMSNLQVASSTPYEFKFSIGIRNDWPELTEIFNKAIKQLPVEKKNEFLKNWLVVNYAQKTDYTLLYWVLLAALLIFSILSLRQRELNKVNAKLKEGRERLSLTLESAHLGTWELTYHNNHITKIQLDSTFARQHFIPDDKSVLNSEQLRQYISAEHIDGILHSLKKYIQGEQQEFIVEYLTKTGHRWIASQGQVLKQTDSGNTKKIMGVSQDITERKEAHLAIQRSSHFKSQFLANMSHEIRTPMNAIVGLGHLLSRTEINEKQTDYIDSLQKSAQTLLGLIDDILDLSKIEAGHLNIENIEFSLEELLSDLANISVIRITKKVDFIYDMGSNVPDVLSGDPFRINQVLSNLVSNSIKFTESGSIILKISVLEKKPPGKHKVELLFEVKDTGIGIAADRLENLFDPFVQEDGSTTRKYGGTGLGLSISRQLIELMGGELAAESNQGEGSNFYFKLPFTVMSTQGQSILNHPSPDLRGLRVLLVDDNPLSLNILSKTLESMSFFVTVASSGKQALQLLMDAKTTEFDVVLLDWRMPGMDGEKTTTQIRKQIPKEKLPIIIMMTAYGREAGEQQVNHLPLDGFLVKPITPSQLFNAIIQARKGTNKKAIARHETITKEEIVITQLDGHILLAEDNKINQQVALEILQQMGLKVSICENGKEVIQLLQNFSPDLILMDIQMPEMDGYETTRVIRNTPKISELPIIAMTANAMAGDIEKSIQVGMNAHISKPVDPQFLYKTLRQYLPVNTSHEQQQTEKSTDDKLINWPDEVPGLNIKKGIKQVGGNEQLYQKLLKDFLNNHENLAVSLQHSIQSGDIKKAGRLAHTIKGVSGNIGADKLMQVVSSFDDKLKHGEKIPQSFISLLDKTCRELCDSLHELFDSSAQPLPDPIIASVKLDITELDQLKSAMQKGDATTEQILLNLAPALSGIIGEQALNNIIDNIQDYEFELALKQLNSALME